jgi:hypothetical protein
MINNQIMKRPFYTGELLQRTQDGYFNANSLIEIYNSSTKSNKKLNDYMMNKNTTEFISKVEEKEMLCLSQKDNNANQHYLENLDYQAIKSTRGKNGGTWVHPLIVIDLAMWLSVDFKYEILKFVNDNLILFRIEAGDNYKDMCKALTDYYIRNKDKEPSRFAFQHEIEFINKLVFGVYEGVDRNNKKEWELKLLDELQILNTNYLTLDFDKEKRREELFKHTMNFKISNKIITTRPVF